MSEHTNSHDGGRYYHSSGPPVVHPTGSPITHPSGPPVVHPSGSPITHPSGPPVVHPYAHQVPESQRGVGQATSFLSPQHHHITSEAVHGQTRATGQIQHFGYSTSEAQYTSVGRPAMARSYHAVTNSNPRPHADNHALGTRSGTPPQESSPLGGPHRFSHPHAASTPPLHGEASPPIAPRQRDSKVYSLRDGHDDSSNRHGPVHHALYSGHTDARDAAPVPHGAPHNDPQASVRPTVRGPSPNQHGPVHYAAQSAHRDGPHSTHEAGHFGPKDTREPLQRVPSDLLQAPSSARRPSRSPEHADDGAPQRWGYGPDGAERIIHDHRPPLPTSWQSQTPAARPLSARESLPQSSRGQRRSSADLGALPSKPTASGGGTQANPQGPSQGLRDLLETFPNWKRADIVQVWESVQEAPNPVQSACEILLKGPAQSSSPLRRPVPTRHSSQPLIHRFPESPVPSAHLRSPPVTRPVVKPARLSAPRNTTPRHTSSTSTPRGSSTPSSRNSNRSSISDDPHNADLPLNAPATQEAALAPPKTAKRRLSGDKLVMRPRRSSELTGDTSSPSSYQLAAQRISGRRLSGDGTLRRSADGSMDSPAPSPSAKGQQVLNRFYASMSAEDTTARSRAPQHDVWASKSRQSPSAIPNSPPVGRAGESDSARSGNCCEGGGARPKPLAAAKSAPVSGFEGLDPDIAGSLHEHFPELSRTGATRMWDMASHTRMELQAVLEAMIVHHHLNAAMEASMGRSSEPLHEVKRRLSLASDTSADDSRTGSRLLTLDNGQEETEEHGHVDPQRLQSITEVPPSPSVKVESRLLGLCRRLLPFPAIWHCFFGN